MEESAQEMLELLVQHELAIKDLYQACSAAYSEEHGFWEMLAAEEQGHADKLGGLWAEPALDQWLTAATRLRSAAVASSIDYVTAQASRVRRGDMTLVQALAVARDIEDALIDRQSLVPAAPVCAEIGGVISALREETERHRQVIAEALETAKRLER